MTGRIRLCEGTIVTEAICLLSMTPPTTMYRKTGTYYLLFPVISNEERDLFTDTGKQPNQLVSFRASIARASVSSSAYFMSMPIGIPQASLVIFTGRACRRLAR